jgi:predicted  nucleic acid-binding Zn-ribbon protein
VDLPRGLLVGATLNAALSDQWRLLDLQALDSRIDQLAHRRRTLPEHAAIAELLARRDQVRDLLVAAQTQDGDIGREQTKAEADVDQVVQRAERDRRRMESGANPKELEALQHEVASLARRQEELEDAVLEIMERREAVQQRVAELTAERDSAIAELSELESRRDAAMAELDEEAAKIGGERSLVAQSIAPDLVALYEKIRASSDGVGAVALRRGRWEGCRIDQSTTHQSDIKAKPEDAVVRCEDCRRILVRVADSGL